MIDPQKTGSPAYVFDLDEFSHRCRKAKEVLNGIPLTYSMKANPFLLNRIPEAITHIEVCSPGELEICMRMGVPGSRIIYSGVCKEAWDVEKAVEYEVDILTAESLLHVQLESAAVQKLKKTETETRKVLLRLTSGNQFGMSSEDILSIIGHQDRYPGLDFYGIHYYSGTQKKQRQIRKDLERLQKLLDALKERFGFEPRLIEYGPGASVEYFEDTAEEDDWVHFAEAAEEVKNLAAKYPVGVEMGRFLASTCGSYVTRIRDSKQNSETNYLICDGGIHHLKYYGQTMAMQVPPIDLVRQNGSIPDVSEEKVPYMLCGSLCTTADVLVREALLPPVSIGDHLVFHRCGAYSVTEGTVLFLSRVMPSIWLNSDDRGLVMVRDHLQACDFNVRMDLCGLTAASETGENG